MNNGSIEPSIDACGVFDIRSSVSGIVYEDRNGNGSIGPEDSLWQGVTINLWVNGVEVASVESGEDGSYHFGELMPGNYQIEFISPDTIYTTAFIIFLERIPCLTVTLGYPDLPIRCSWVYV